MKTHDCESGYVGDTDLIGIATSTFSNIMILRGAAMSVTASGERYGHRWFLKSLPPADESLPAAQRLRKEFEILSGLRHIGIVQVVSLEEVDGLGLTMVMEWIEGKSLETILAENTLTKKERRKLALDIVDAVAFMHAAGIVHRDLKPSNIMIRKNGGFPVIVDFGLADTDSHTLLKQAGGTEGYMSPEVMQGHEADTRDDVYSLGKIVKLLSADFGGICRKCMLPEGKRYSDAGKVKSAMLRRVTFMKRAFYLALAAIVLTALICMGWEIDSLQKKIGRDARTIYSLNDSVAALRSNIEAAESHETEIVGRINACTDMLKEIYQQYDRKEVDRMIARGVSAGDISGEVVDKVNKTITAYLEGLKDNVAEEDYASIYNGVWQREVHMYDEWQKKVLDGER